MQKLTKADLYTTDCIKTFTGLTMNVFEPTEEMICIEDIAHALSMQCRFAGHTTVFYSVAQHSIRCSFFNGDKEFKLQGLLHDASEAYLLDMPAPIKKRLPEYKAIEDQLMKVIAAKFGFEYPLSDRIKEIDKYILEAEWDDLMVSREYHLGFVLSQSMAEQCFLKRYETIISL